MACNGHCEGCASDCGKQPLRHPNITGAINAVNGRTVGDTYFAAEGCFYLDGNASQLGNAIGEGYGGRLTVSASRSSSLFGSSSSVQPASLRCLACIKI